MFTDRRTAELIKYAANAFLATKITFINEIADLAEKVGADVQESRARHRARQPHRLEIPARRARLRRLVLSQGHGGAAQDRSRQWRAAAHRRGGGGGQRRAQARDGAQGVAALGGELRGKTIAVLGLTFKPNTDDMRESPSISLITALQDMGAKVRAYDPTGMEQAKLVLPSHILQGRLRLRRGRLCAGDRHRMGAVPRARFRPAEEGDAEPGAGRPAQHLPAGGSRAPRLYL